MLRSKKLCGGPSASNESSKAGAQSLQAGRLKRASKRNHSQGRNRAVAALGFATAAALSTFGVRAAQGASATWSATPTNGNWEAGGSDTNWSTGIGTFPGTVGTLTNGDTATFSANSSTSTSISITSASGLNIKNITFGVGGGNAAAYTIGTVGGNSLLVSSGGAITVVNNGSTNVQTVNAPIVIEPASGNTTAGNYTFINSSGTGTNNLIIAGDVSGGTTSANITLRLDGGSGPNGNLVSGNISDGGAAGGLAIVKANGSTWALSGTNTYSGSTTITGGVLKFTSSNALGGGQVTNNIVLGSATLDYSGANGASTDLGVNRTLTLTGGTSNILVDNAATLTVSGNVTNTATDTFAISPNNASATVVLSGIISDGVGVTTFIAGKSGGSGSGNGTVELSGANTYTGNTYMNFASGGFLKMSGSNSSNGTTETVRGTLILNNASNGGLASGNLILGGGNLQANTAAAGNLTNNVIFGNTFAGTGFAGNQSITFNGNATNTFVTETLTNSLTAGNVTFAGAQFNLGNLSVAFAGTGNTIVNSVVQDYSGGVGAAGGNITLGNTGGGVTILTNNANSYTGTTTISGKGAATVEHAFGDTSSLTVQGAGNLSLRNDSDMTLSKLTGSVLLNAIVTGSGATFNVDQATVAGTGAKTMTIGNITSTSVAAAYTLNFTGANNTSLSTGNITGSAAAAGTVTLNNTIAPGGNLIIASYKSANTGGGETLVLGGSGNTIIGAINGNGTPMALTKSGTGTATLTAASTYGNTTTISGGVLTTSGSGNIGVGGLTMSGGTLDLAGKNQTVANLSITSAAATGNTIQNGNLTIATGPFAASNASGNAIVSANINAGSLQLSKSGAGTLALSGLNVYSGGTNLTAGTLAINNGGNATASAIGTGTLIIAGGIIDNTSGGDITLLTNNAQTWTNNVTYTGSNNSGLNLGTGAVSLGATTGTKTVTVTNGNLTVGGVISNGATGNLTKAGAGTLILTGNNLYNGLTTVSAGTLRFGAAGALPTNGNLTVSAGALADLSGNAFTSTLVTNNGNITGGSGGFASLTMGNGSTGTGNFLGNQNVVINAAIGASSLTGAWTNAGNVTANTTGVGSITLGSVTASNNIGGFVSHTGAGVGNLTIAGNTTIGGLLSQSTASNTTLSGQSISLGGLSVSNGFMKITGGTTALSTGTVSVTGAGNLSLVNTVGTSLSVSALTLGTSGNTSVLNFELGNSTNYDRITTGATATTAGTIKFNLSTLAGFDSGTYTLLSAASGLNSAAYTFNLISPGYTYTTSVSGSAVLLNVNSLNASANTVYWGGGQDFSWTTNNAGTTNWFTDSGNTTNLGGTPGAASTVVFSTTTAGTSTTGNLTTTLDGNYTIAALALNGNPSGAQVMTINAGTPAGSRLTITGNSTGVGIDAQTSANLTFGAGVTLAGNQSWTIISGKTLSASGGITGISGNSVLTKEGAGTLALNGTNSFDQLIVNAGILTTTSTSTSLGAGTLVLGNASMSGASVRIDAAASSTSNVSNNILVQGNGTVTLAMATNNNGTTWSGNITLNNTLTTSTNNGGGSMLFSGRLIGSNGVTVTTSTDNNASHPGFTNFTGNSATSFTGNVVLSAPSGSGDNLVFFNDGSLGNETLTSATQTVTFAANAGLVWNGTNTQDISSRFIAPPSGNMLLGVNTASNEVVLNHLDTSLAGATAGIKKIGVGTLTITTANTFSGGVGYGSRTTNSSLNTASGNIAIGNDAALGTGTFTMSGTAGLRSMDTTGHTLANVVGTFGVGTVATFGDSNNVATGSLTFGNTTATSIGAGGTTSMSVWNTTTFSGKFTGTGNLTKAGTGILVLNSGGNYTGNTSVTAGRLIAVGGLTSNVTIAGGATFGGTGTFTKTVTTANNTAVISPGASPGDMTVGNVSIAAGGRMKFELGSTDAVGISDHLIITSSFTGTSGSADGGMVLDITAWGFDPAGPKTGVTYTVVSFSTATVTGLEAGDVNIGNLTSGLVLDTFSGYDTDGVNDGVFVDLSGKRIQVQFSSVPEPTSLSVLGLGVGGLLARRRRRRK